MTQLSTYETMIMKSGSKLTKQRKQILKVIIDHPHEHFSAEALYDLVKHIDDSIGIATVYRTLELFEKLGIVRNVKIKNDGVNYYDVVDLDEENHFHHHLICTNCRRIIEIADELESYETFIEQKYGFQVKDHDLTLYGICSDCQSLENSEKHLQKKGIFTIKKRERIICRVGVEVIITPSDGKMGVMGYLV